MSKKKNLDDIKLMISPLSNNIYIGQVENKVGEGLIFSDNKKDITSDFFDMMIRYCLASCEEEGYKKGIEWGTKAGTLRFTKKVEDK